MRGKKRQIRSYLIVYMSFFAYFFGRYSVFGKFKGQILGEIWGILVHSIISISCKNKLKNSNIGTISPELNPYLTQLLTYLCDQSKIKMQHTTMK